MSAHNYTKAEFIEVVQRFPVIYTVDMDIHKIHSHAFCSWIPKNKMPLLLVDKASEYSFSKEGFISFVRKEAPDLKANM